MIADVKGLVLEKFVKDRADKETGKITQQFFVRMFQKGERNGVDVEVRPEVFEKIKENTTAELKDIKVSAWNGMMFAKELALNE